MPAPSTLFARHVRAGVVGVWAVLGASLAHTSQVGGPPPLVALVPAAGAATAVAWWAGSQRLRFATTFALLALAQLAVHLLSAYVHGHAMTPSASMVLAHLASTAVVAAGVVKAEQLIWACWERVVRRVPRLPGTFPGLASSRVPAGSRTVTHGALLGHAVSRRGPPPS